MATYCEGFHWLKEASNSLHVASCFDPIVVLGASSTVVAFGVQCLNLRGSWRLHWSFLHLETWDLASCCCWGLFGSLNICAWVSLKACLQFALGHCECVHGVWLNKEGPWTDYWQSFLQDLFSDRKDPVLGVHMGQGKKRQCRCQILFFKRPVHVTVKF